MPGQISQKQTGKKKLELREGAKYDEGKLRYDLIPARPLAKLAEVYTIGAEKYNDRNWEQGIKFSRLFAAMMRHAWSHWMGRKKDPEDGQEHLSSIVWCAFAMQELEETHPEFDDRPENDREPLTKVQK